MSKTKKTRKTALRKYRVTYVVTRSEPYEIEAVNEAEASENAFFEGEFAGYGETTNVDALEVEEIKTTARDKFEAAIQAQIAEHCASNHGSRTFRPAAELIDALLDTKRSLEKALNELNYGCTEKGIDELEGALDGVLAALRDLPRADEKGGAK